MSLPRLALDELLVSSFASFFTVMTGIIRAGWERMETLPLDWKYVGELA